MKLEIGNNQGHVIIDDTTGKIMFVLVQNTIKDRFDFHSFASYKNNHDGTHDAIRWINLNDDIQLDEDETAAEERMLIIMQNGNTGEHYDIFQEEE